jgi:uncharacterized protein YjbI with pentapeptide repeats
VESTDYYRVTYLEAVADRDKEALKQAYEFSYAFTLDEGEREMIIQMKFTDEAYVRLQLFPINDVIGETYISDEEASDNTIIESWRESDKKEYSLAGLTLNNILLYKSVILGVAFDGAIIKNSNFEQAILVGCVFSDIDIVNCNFMQADLRSTDFSVATIKANSNFTKANFKYAYLEGAEFTNVNLTGADFRHTNLLNVKFINCTLTGVKLFGSNYQETNAQGQEFDNVNADLAEFSEEERLANEQMEQEAYARAMEIHEAFAHINMDKYLAILDQTINDANVAAYQANIIDYALHIFLSKIDEIFIERNDNKEKIKRELTEVLEKFGLSALASDEKVKLQIGKTIDYVSQQSPAFIKLYLSSFVKDCYEAYEGEGGLSCVKGIAERFITLLRDTLEIECIELDKCDKIQIELLDFFHGVLDINEITQEWVKSWEDRVQEAGKEKDWKTLSEEAREQDYVKFIKDKYKSTGIDITSAYFLKILNDRLDGVVENGELKVPGIRYIFADMENIEPTFGGKKIKTLRKGYIKKRKPTIKKQRKPTIKKRKPTIKKQRKPTIKKRKSTMKKRKPTIKKRTPYIHP